MKIRILQSQKEYLRDHVLEGRDDLIQEIEKGKLVKNKWEIGISDATADDIRDLCSEKLQKIGFDENYNLTEQGKVLEELIDAFFVP